MHPRLALLLALLPLAAHALTVDGIPISRNVEAMAREVITALSPKDALLAGDTPLAGHPYFQQLVRKVDFNKVHEEATVELLRLFTPDEIQALHTFQNSPEGRSIQAKMPGFQKIIGSLIHNHLKAALDNQFGSLQQPAATSAPQGSGGSPVAPPQGTGGSPIR
ncbi:MAG: hypothetical protein H6922_04645 [Pseudomonadaceae bacterium]|nr:hypothetical protein [Pseudomonadaceae bacterium]